MTSNNCGCVLNSKDNIVCVWVSDLSWLGLWHLCVLTCGHPRCAGMAYDMMVFMQVYWLNVDYHAVAQAALQCSQCLTALLYLEQWCEERHGRLVLGDAELLSEVQNSCTIAVSSAGGCMSEEILPCYQQRTLTAQGCHDGFAGPCPC